MYKHNDTLFFKSIAILLKQSSNIYSDKLKKILQINGKKLDFKTESIHIINNNIIYDKDNYILADDTLPFKAKCFDLTLVIFPTKKNLEKSITEALRVTKKSGLILVFNISYFSIDGILSLLGLKCLPYNLATHEKIFDLSQKLPLFKKSTYSTSLYGFNKFNAGGIVLDIYSQENDLIIVNEETCLA